MLPTLSPCSRRTGTLTNPPAGTLLCLATNEAAVGMAAAGGDTPAPGVAVVVGKGVGVATGNGVRVGVGVGRGVAVGDRVTRSPVRVPFHEPKPPDEPRLHLPVNELQSLEMSNSMSPASVGSEYEGASDHLPIKVLP